MNFQAAKKTTINIEKVKHFAAICGLFFGACILGAALIAFGGESNSQTFALGILAVFAISAVTCLVLELPVINLVRCAFIASFFFKGELNLHKINEIEDPSGFNVSLTLFSALILLIYDRFISEEVSEEKTFPSSFSFLTLALFFCALISVLYSGAPMLGWFSLWSFSTSILIAYVIASHFSRQERLVQLIVGIAAGLLFTGAVALSQYVADFPSNLAFFGTGTEEEMLGTQSIELSRVPAFLRTPTEMAWVVSTLIPLVLAPIICRVKSIDSRQKLVLFVGVFSGVVAVILSLARGSWISLLMAVAMVILFGWYRLSSREKKNYLFSVGGVLVFSCLLLAPFSGRIHERLTADDDGSALIRVPLMETAFRMIEDNSLVGVGLNEYRSSMTKYDETGIFVSQVFPNPVHNVFAHITAEIGIPGGLIFCLLIFAAFIECLRTMNVRDRLLFALALGAAAGIIAFVISAMKEPGSLGSVRPPIRTLFFLIGIVSAIGRIRRRLML